jgi:flagella basal body P-ring formation protein FlgA
MLKLIALTAVLTCSAFGACFPVAGDRIYGSDLAAAIPAFAALSPNMTIAYAPVPGTRRIFAVAELARIARANRVNLPDPVEVCFEIPMRPLTEEETLASMRRALPPETQLTIVELPKTSIPAGRLEFVLSGLEPAARGSRVWRGSVRYGDTLRMPVWARVTVQRKSMVVVAAKDLALNVPIDPAWLRLETVSVPLESERVALRIEDVYGRVPARPVHAGETIPLSILNFPPAVHRGDPVTVEVQSGAARLRFDAVAEGPARAGDMVELRNPSNGRTFRARVEQAGRAVVVIPARQSL